MPDTTNDNSTQQTEEKDTTPQPKPAAADTAGVETQKQPSSTSKPKSDVQKVQQPLQIKLSRAETPPETLPYIVERNVFVYQLRMSLTANIDFEDPTAEPDNKLGYPAKLFVLQLSGTGFDPDQGDIFVRIANLTDVYELPTEDKIHGMNERSCQRQTPYYRVSAVKLACASIDEADKVYNTAKALLAKFVDNYNSQRLLVDSDSIVL